MGHAEHKEHAPIGVCCSCSVGGDERGRMGSDLGRAEHTKHAPPGRVLHVRWVRDERGGAEHEKHALVGVFCMFGG